MKRIRDLLLAALIVPALSVGALMPSVAPTLAQSASAAAVVNVNTATAEQLQTLPGVGPATAAAIIKARPFSDLKDFQARVKGLSAADIAKLTPLVTFSAAAPATGSSTGRSATADGTDAKIAALKKSGRIINVNTASAADLQLLPHVGDKTAAEIIKNRPYKDLNDLKTKVKGIGDKSAADLAPFISFK